MSKEVELAYMCHRGCTQSSRPGGCAECGGTLWSPTRIMQWGEERDRMRLAAVIARTKAEERHDRLLEAVQELLIDCEDCDCDIAGYHERVKGLLDTYEKES